MLGVWLAISPWLLGFNGFGAAMWNVLIVGIVVAVLALWTLGTDKDIGGGARPPNLHAGAPRCCPLSAYRRQLREKVGHLGVTRHATYSCRVIGSAWPVSAETVCWCGIPDALDEPARR